MKLSVRSKGIAADREGIPSNTEVLFYIVKISRRTVFPWIPPFIHKIHLLGNIQCSLQIHPWIYSSSFEQPGNYEDCDAISPQRRHRKSTFGNDVPA